MQAKKWTHSTDIWIVHQVIYMNIFLRKNMSNSGRQYVLKNYTHKKGSVNDRKGEAHISAHKNDPFLSCYSFLFLN